MKQFGDYKIAASRDAVWDALNDPHILGSCILGCESIKKLGETNFDIFVKAKVGPVKAKMRVQLELTDLVPQESYTIQGAAKVGVAEFVKGTAFVSLSDQDGGTVLAYEVDANMKGKLAQVDNRLIDGAARKIADDFFSNFAQRVPSE